jgi:hypothetical protein
MTGDVELAAVIVAAGIVPGAVIVGIALVVAAGCLRKRESASNKKGPMTAETVLRRIATPRDARYLKNVTVEPELIVRGTTAAAALRKNWI